MADLALIDAHCHLDEMARRGVSVVDALARAHRAGVHQVVTSGDGLTDSQEASRLADVHPEVFFTVGWHPINPRPPTDSEVEDLRQLLSHPKAVAVGEIGLDYLLRPGHLETPRAIQREMFSSMLALAQEVGRPVVVHLRHAHQELLELIDSGPTVPVMLHCFSGDSWFAEEASRRGLLCSFAGNLTFRSAHDLRAALKVVPTDLLVVETDSPFLAPEPHRGSVCEPARVVATASRAAIERGECLDTLARAATGNTRGFFKLPAP
ncbi:MAG: TatD family hydrolase [Candidatus Dormibacteria bacterium]